MHKLNFQKVKKMKDKLKEKLLQKLKSDKKLLLIVLVGVLGMALIFLSELLPTDKKEKEVVDLGENVSYEETVEQKLKNLIESIDGAGSAQVMVVFESSKESVFAKDSDEDTESGEKNDSKKTKSKYIIVEKGGEENGLLTKAVYPAVCGVAIVCDGAGDSVIKQRIVETVSALFDINSKNISVVRKAG